MCCGINKTVFSFNEKRSLLDLYCLIRSISWSVKMCCGINETVSSFNEKSSRQDLSA